MAIAEKESPWFKYNCEHGFSNDPCPTHFPGEPVAGENWAADYEPAPGT